jgi:hypothetical protein
MIRTGKLTVVFCLFVAVGLIGQQGCAKAPLSLSPAGVTAFQNSQIQKSLDTIRDIAIDANATTPPVLDTATTRKVVTWHQSAITVLHARGAGWVVTLAAGLDELLKNIPAEERQTLLPYVTLAKTVLIGVTKS